MPILWLMANLIISPVVCQAGQINITPSIQVTGEYDDNILFSKDDSKKVSDYFTRIIPALKIGYKTERMDFGLNANYNIRRYASDSQLNTDQWRVTLKTGYQFTEKFNGSINFGYTQDDTLDTELEETGLVTIRSERSTISAGAGFGYALTELSYLSFNYAYREVNYDDPLRLDSDRHSFGLSYSRRLQNSLDTISISPSYSRNENDDSKSDNFNLSFGWNHSFSETSNLSMSLGGSFAQKELKNVQGSSQDTWGVLANIVYSLSGERSDFSIGFNQDVSYSITNEPILKSRLFANYGYKITEMMEFRIRTSLLYSQSAFDDSNIDSQNVKITPSLSYKVSPNGSLSLTYNYDYNNNDSLAVNKDGDRHRLTLSYNYGFSKNY